MTNLDLINRAFHFTVLAAADLETCKALGVATHKDIIKINQDLQTAGCAIQMLDVNLRENHTDATYEAPLKDHHDSQCRRS